MTVIKAALTGDMHVTVPKREEEAQRIAYWMLEDWKKRGVDFIGIAGDLVDGPMTERQRAWLIEYIVACSDVAPVVLIEGNHEVALALRNAVGRFQLARSKDRVRVYPGVHPIIVEDDAGVHVVDTASGPLAVACVSYPRKAQLLAAVNDQRRLEAERNNSEYRPVSGEEVDEITGHALQGVFRGLGARVRELGLPTVALIHGTIQGSKISADDQPDRPLGLDIPLRDVGLLGAQFYCVAHIHKAQHWSIDNSDSSGIVATPSCPFFSDYGEAKHEKGYILAHFDSDWTMAQYTGDDPSSKPFHYVEWERVPTPATPMLLVEMEWKELVVGYGWSLISNDQKIGTVEGCDVRLRYRFTGDQRKPASAAAEDVRKRFLESGAINVTLDPVLIPTVKARIPELATTPRLEDKWLLYVGSLNLELSDERRATLLDLLRQLQEEASAAGMDVGVTGRTAPTIQKVRLRGFLKFPNEITIDFEKLGGNLTAIVAPNEMGKTVLMQVIGHGVLYGRTPDRGSLDDLSIAKDSFVEETFYLNHKTWTLTQNANGKDRKGSVSLIQDNTGTRGPSWAVLERAGRDEYKEGWAAKNLLPENVYKALICQSGSESIIDMSDGPRVEVLLRTLGLEVYEVLAEFARRKATAVGEQLKSTQARLDELGSVDVAGAAAVVDALRAEVASCEQSAHDAEVALQKARQDAEQVSQQRAAYAAALKARDSLSTQKLDAERSVNEIRARIVVQQELLNEATVITAAVATLADLTAQRIQKDKEHTESRLKHEHVKSEVATLQSKREEVVQRVASYTTSLNALQSRLEETVSQLSGFTELVSNADTIQDAVAKTKDLEASLDTKLAEESSARDEVTNLRSQLSELEARLNGNAQRQSEETRRVQRANEQLSRADEVVQAELQIKQIEEEHKRAENKHQEISERLSRTQVSHAQVITERFALLRTGLLDIAELRVKDPAGSATATLEADNKLSSEIDEATAGALEKGLHQIRESLKQLESQHAALLLVTGRRFLIDAAQVSLEESQRLKESLVAEAAGITADKTSVTELLDEASSQLERVRHDIKWLRDEIESYAGLVLRSEQLATARVEILHLEKERDRITEGLEDGVFEKSKLETTILKEIDGQVVVQVNILAEVEGNQSLLSAEVARLQREIEELQPIAAKSTLLTEARIRIEHLQDEMGNAAQRVDDLTADLGDANDRLATMSFPELVDVSVWETAVRSAQQASSNRNADLGIALRELRIEEKQAARQKELKNLRAEHEVLLANWTLLGNHLGKDGLQKAEINCAGPQLTDRTNELLLAAGDTRHTVSIETERLHSNKKQMVPCLNINVFDSVEGITKESRLLSGAGKGIVGLPFTLALVSLGCQRAGIKGPTIFLDEATGAMDPENSDRYVAMVRHFAEILESHVVFVSQNPAVSSQADNQILIDNGVVTTRNLQ